MMNSLSTKVMAATVIGVLSIGTVACSSDGDNNDTPTDTSGDSPLDTVDDVVNTVDDVVNSAVDQVEGVVDTLDDAVGNVVDDVEGVIDTIGDG